MYSGFPLKFLHMVRCPQDNGLLRIPAKKNVTNGLIWDQALSCISCNESYEVKEGILSLLNKALLDDESIHELNLRETSAQKPSNNIKNSNLDNMDMMEIAPTVKKLNLKNESLLLELGCGTGRYSVQILNEFPNIGMIAVDFSIFSLRKLAEHLTADHNIGLIQADITNLKLTESSFDRILSTLVSNLPTHQHRKSMFCLAAKTLKENGLFIFSTHHFGIRDKLENIAKDGRYSHGGIYRHFFTKKEILNETAEFFHSMIAFPIQIVIPFANRLKLPVARLSFICQRIPLVNELAKLLLIKAWRPKKLW